MRNPPFNNEQRLGFIAATPDPFKVARWGLALIFGGFKQGKSRLEDPQTGAMCCVGVLCKISPGVDRKMLGTTANFIGYEVIFTVPVKDSLFATSASGYIEPMLMLGGDEDTVAELTDLGEYPDFAVANDERDVSFRTIGLWLLGTVPTLLINKLRGRHG